MNSYRKGVLLVLATAFISGFSIWLNAYGVTGITAGVFAGLKNLGVGLVLTALLLATRRWRDLASLSRRSWLALGLVGLVGGSAPFILFFTGLSQTTAARAGFIHKTMFIYVALLAALFLKERITKVMLVGIGALLLGQIIFLQTLPRSFTTGDALILAATLLWAVETVISKRLLSVTNAGVVAWGRMFFGGIFIWIYVILAGDFAKAFSLTYEQQLWVVVTTLFLIGYVLTFYHGLALVPAHVATSLLALGAPATAILQAVYSDKTMALPEVAGIGIMIASAVWLIRLNRKRPAAHVLQSDYR